MFKKSIIIGFFFLSIASYGQRTVNILFVGNSLTYFNKLPEMMKRIAAYDSVEMTFNMLAFPNYALVDHWNDGVVIKEIGSKKYNIVVVQQGPSSQKEGRDYLLQYGLKIDSLCDKNKTAMAVYMVWPSKDRSGDFQGVYESYKLLADSAKAIFCPGGKAWLNVWSTHPEIKLYGDDNFHPGYDGTLLAAMVIYGSVMKKNNIGFIPYYEFKNPQLSKEVFQTLRQTAQLTLKEFSQKKKSR